MIRDFAVPCIASLATVAGTATAGFIEDFNAGGPFPWEVQDYQDGGSFVVGWDFNYNVEEDGVPRGNFATADGGAAHVCSDLRPFGSGPYDIAMISPWTQVEGKGFLSYVVNYQTVPPNDQLLVEITTDGENWSLLKQYDEDTGLFPMNFEDDFDFGVSETIDLAEYLGRDARVRFRYVGDGWNWFAQIDNVVVTPAPGALSALFLAAASARRRRRR
jgi:hypothetical protein